MKIFGHPMSTCTRKILATLAEKGAHADFVTVDIFKGEQKQPTHLSRQPFGVVPAFEHGDFKMYESRAICRYLDETLPGPSLTPKDPKKHALMEQWISNEMSYFTPSALGLLYEHMFNPAAGKPTDPAKVEELEGKLKKTLAVVEENLSHNQYMAGDTFTLADISFMPYVEYLLTTPSAKLFKTPAVTAWWTRVSARPSWQKAIGKA
jgi:glutathione S-transferase